MQKQKCIIKKTQYWKTKNKTFRNCNFTRDLCGVESLNLFSNNRTGKVERKF